MPQLSLKEILLNFKYFTKILLDPQRGTVRYYGMHFFFTFLSLNSLPNSCPALTSMVFRENKKGRGGVDYLSIPP